MKMTHISGALMILLVLFGIYPAAGTQFGNVAIFLDKTVTEDFAPMAVQLEGESDEKRFGSARDIVIWNIFPGEYNLQLIFADSRKSENLPISIYPGLTCKVLIESKGGQYILAHEGFADQSGHLLTYDRNGINSFPGELKDGLGSMSGQIDNENLFSYEGLSFSESSRGKRSIPTGKTTPDLALVNISDPFAGYIGEDISLISNFGGPKKIGLESVYATRDGRFHRIAASHELPRKIGFFFGSVGFENLADAEPRRNVDGSLPHNDAENVEFMGGAGFRILSRFKSDVRIFYKSIYRNYYNHAYYFDIDHAPKEKANIYKGRVSIYGRVIEDIFAHAGYAIQGDDDKYGDGVYFDNILGYSRPSGNPGYDSTNLFYSWDNMDGITPSVDESHVYESYSRYLTRGRQLFLNLSRDFRQTIQLSLNMNYGLLSFRKYYSPLSTYFNGSNVENIGFDSLGIETNDMNGFSEIPKSRKLDVSFGAKKVAPGYFLALSTDYTRFDAGTQVFKNLKSPLDPNRTHDDSSMVLNRSDMREAEATDKMGYRLAAGISVMDNVSLFANVYHKYSFPVCSLLYFSQRFFEYDYRYFLSGKHGNPELGPMTTNHYELGLRYLSGGHAVVFSYQHETITDWWAQVIILAESRAYLTYANQSDKKSTDAFVMTWRNGENSFISTSLLAKIEWGKQWYADYPKYAVEKIFESPGSYINKTTYKLAGTLTLNAGKLDLQGDALYKNIISRLALDVLFLYKNGARYTKRSGNPLDPGGLLIDLSPIGKYTARDFLEINVALTSHLLEFRGASLSARLEVLNLFDRANYPNVYPTTGSPDNTDYLSTPEGQFFIEYFDEPHDSSGLTGEQKYLLRQNDPGNFGRPRIFRLMVRLEF